MSWQDIKSNEDVPQERDASPVAAAERIAQTGWKAIKANTPEVTVPETIGGASRRAPELATVEEEPKPRLTGGLRDIPAVTGYYARKAAMAIPGINTAEVALQKLPEQIAAIPEKHPSVPSWLAGGAASAASMIPAPSTVVDPSQMALASTLGTAGAGAAAGITRLAGRISPEIAEALTRSRALPWTRPPAPPVAPVTPPPTMEESAAAHIERMQAELGQAQLPGVRTASPQLALPEPKAPTLQAERPEALGPRVKGPNAEETLKQWQALRDRADTIQMDIQGNNELIEGLERTRTAPLKIEGGVVTSPIRNEFAVPQSQKPVEIYRLRIKNQNLAKEFEDINTQGRELEKGMSEEARNHPASFTMNAQPRPGMVGPRGGIQRFTTPPIEEPANVPAPALPPETEFTGGERPKLAWTAPKPEELPVAPTTVKPKGAAEAIALRGGVKVEPEYIEATQKALASPENIHDPGNPIVRIGMDRNRPFAKMGLPELHHALMDSHNVASLIRDEANMPVAEALGNAGAIEGSPESTLIHRGVTGTANPAEQQAIAASPEAQQAVSAVRAGYAKLASRLNEAIGTNLNVDDFYSPRVPIAKMAEAMHMTPEEMVRWLQERGAGEPSFLKQRTAIDPQTPLVEDLAKLWNWYVNAAAKLAGRQEPLRMLRGVIEQIVGRPEVDPATGKSSLKGGWVNDQSIPATKRAELRAAATFLDNVEKAELKAPTGFEQGLGEMGQRTASAIRSGVDLAAGKGVVPKAVAGKVEELRKWADDIAESGTPGQAGVGRRISGSVRGAGALGRFGLSVPSMKLHAAGKIIKMEAVLGPIMTGKNIQAIAPLLEDPVAGAWFKAMGLDREVGGAASEGVDISGAGPVSRGISKIQDTAMLHFKYTESALNRVAWGASWDIAKSKMGWAGDRAVALAAKDIYSRAVSRYNASAEPLLFSGEMSKLGFQGMRSAVRQLSGTMLDTTVQQKINLALGIGAYYGIRRLMGSQKAGQETIHQAVPVKVRGLFPQAIIQGSHPTISGAEKLLEQATGLGVVRTGLEEGKQALDWLRAR